MEKKYKIILSGGGTGGHIYPAVSVAQALVSLYGEGVEILFVGAQGRMEMEKIPALGYSIKGLPVAGLQRRLSASNLSLPWKVVKSVRQARRVIREFGADVVAGFGGYASAPVLWSAQRMGIPTLIQEQNSYAGVTNKILSRRARKICVAYEGMERFFPADRIEFTGNPLRGDFGDVAEKKQQALDYFGFTASRPVILIVGGSLGTRTLNEAVKKHIDSFTGAGSPQLIWQTGSFYRQQMDEFCAARELPGIHRCAFIERMDLAYAAADVVISRSGACSVSELSLVGKPVIFVPSPNVAEDHQTKNAMALVRKDAAIMVNDSEAAETVIPKAIELLNDRAQMKKLSDNILLLSRKDSAEQIARMIMEMAASRDN